MCYTGNTSSERCRELMRLVVRAWREEADGRHARSKRVSLPSTYRTQENQGQLIVQGGPRGRLGTDCLPTMHTTVRPRKPTQEEAVQEGKVAAEAHLHKEMMARERKCEGGGGALPVARSAVPAGTRARLLLTYTRSVAKVLGQ